MSENHRSLVLVKRSFAKRLMHSILIGFLIVLLSLLIGMAGYHHFEQMSWLDAYLNAAMILSGMGPVADPQTVGGKIFAGTYALFSGVIFLIVVGLIFAPLFHRLLHQFNVEEDKK
ncbi:two pore domain potassium channel family protein [Candidatus Protochlamydia phocaeensis]|uniref:two pore domain potassium channel family protein n=1 Tax=Candidatus Protochlamydia phocaeensis TaxID=1414722 RepID=UPI0008391AE2|nr:two pore domain potassium channel family protein [Candidatus Protochlamydia phocaeensis]